MFLKNPAGSDSPLLKFDTLDSTNNYAMQVIDADKAEHGLIILADLQTGGKGQRGKNWYASPGESLLMSLIVKPAATLQDQTRFLAVIASAVAEAVEECLKDRIVKIKWPNDIIIGDKKAGGILIENVVRGNSWEWAVIGIGLNVSQTQFPPELPFATSLTIEGFGEMDREQIAARIGSKILNYNKTGEVALNTYNSRLYKRGILQEFKNGNAIWYATILEMNAQGQLVVMNAGGEIDHYTHGSVEWVWARG